MNVVLRAIRARRQKRRAETVGAEAEARAPRIISMVVQIEQVTVIKIPVSVALLRRAHYVVSAPATMAGRAVRAIRSKPKQLAAFDAERSKRKQQRIQKERRVATDLRKSNPGASNREIAKLVADRIRGSADTIERRAFKK